MDNIIRTPEDWVAVRDRWVDAYTYVIPADRVRMHHVIAAVRPTRIEAFRVAIECNRLLRRILPGEIDILRVVAAWDRDRHIRELEEARERCDRAMYVGTPRPSFFDVSDVFRSADRCAYAARTP